MLSLRGAERRSRLIKFLYTSLHLYALAFVMYVTCMGFLIFILTVTACERVLIASSALSISLSAVLLLVAARMANVMKLRKKYLTYPTRCVYLYKELYCFFAGIDPYTKDMEFSFKLLYDRLGLRLKYRKEDYPREYESTSTNLPIEEVSVATEVE